MTAFSHLELDLDDSPNVVRAVDRALASGRFLRFATVEERVELVVRAAEYARALAEASEDALASSSGLSVESVRAALASTFDAIDRRDLHDLVRATFSPRGAPSPARFVAVILAGNVFTAPMRAALLPLLVGAPVVAKASVREHVFPVVLSRAVARAAAESSLFPPDVSPLEVVVFDRNAKNEEEALIDRADVVSAYGGDATLRALRARIPAGARFVGHGHGLGIAVVTPDALRDESRYESTLAALAEDVVAYDQRGCLSPHAAVIVAPREIALRFADHFHHRALASFAATRPRGAIPVEAGALQVQWRSVALVRGDLFEGDGYATSLEDPPLRMTPGYRNVLVTHVDHLAALPSLLAPLGTHLKCVGVAGSLEDRRRIARSLLPPLAPSVVRLGEMQRPRVVAHADGWPALADYVRFVDLA